MDETGISANSNKALSHFLKNPKRDLAVKSLEQTITLLVEANVPREMIVEVMFAQMSMLVIPDDRLDARNATIWYAQLNRMRDEIQTQITLIEAELDKVE